MTSTADAKDLAEPRASTARPGTWARRSSLSRRRYCRPGVWESPESVRFRVRLICAHGLRDGGFSLVPGCVTPDSGGKVDSGPIGRGAEIAEIGAFLSAASGAPAALTITGDAGIGKTMVWNTWSRPLVDRPGCCLARRPRPKDRLSSRRLMTCSARLLRRSFRRFRASETSRGGRAPPRRVRGTCERRKLCHLMRPGHIRGSRRRAGRAAGHGHTHFLRVNRFAERADCGSALGVAGGCCSDRRTHEG